MRGTRCRCLAAGLAIGLALSWAGPASAQPGQVPSPSVQPINQSADPILKAFKWRSIGPANMGGRIDDIEVVEGDTFTQYVGFATGGLWKTVNNGTTWTPIFDTYAVSSIGDIAIAKSNPNIIWVGTGEANNRQSSSFGDGIYKSTDGGKTFTHMGLKDTQSIARVVIHPRNPNIVYVAVDRTPVRAEPGARAVQDDRRREDLDQHEVHRRGHRVHRGRDRPGQSRNPVSRPPTSGDGSPWGFNGGGPGSALWKTTDGGRTWTKLEAAGLPAGLLGRIGARPSAGRSPTSCTRRSKSGPAAEPALASTPTASRLCPASRARLGRRRCRGQAPPPPDAAKSGVWRSDDGGKSWRIVSNNNDRPMYYSQIRVDPMNPEIVYTLGAPFHKSVDGGQTFRTVGGIAHGDHHALWIDPTDGRHLIVGNDGGLDVSYDQAATWEFIDTMAVGQFYHVGVDMQKPYRICGGLQDNGSFCGPSADAFDQRHPEQ